MLSKTQIKLIGNQQKEITALRKNLNLALNALNIFDDCFGEISFAFGHFLPRIKMGEQARESVMQTFRNAEKAQKILFKLEQQRKSK